MNTSAMCYLRIGRSARGYVFDATSKPSRMPLRSGQGHELPTVCVKLRLKLPDDVFDPAIAVLEAEVPKRDVSIAMEVRKP